MKILIANYRYFISGGPERYLFNVSTNLKKHHHVVIPFSINYSKNRKTIYSRFFVSPLGTPDQLFFRDLSKNPRVFVNSMKRLFYDPAVEKRVMELVNYSKPDMAYILKYLRWISPSILVGLKKKNIPIVVRVSDYEMICPGLTCFREDQPCLDCLEKTIWESVKYKCVQKSMPVSFLNYLASIIHKKTRVFDLIDQFVVTNNFMYQMMIRAGYDQSRIVLLNTFIDTDKSIPAVNNRKDDHIIYIGRLEKYKGVHILLNAWKIYCDKYPDSKTRLIIIGDGSPDYETELFQKNNNGRVNFMGWKCESEIIKYLQTALFSVVPSLWFDNLPHSLIESYSCGTPVIASDHGSLSEFVKERETGLLFQPGNELDLAEKIDFCLSNKDLLRHMSVQSRKYSLKIFSPETHIQRLEELFSVLLKK